jgi:DNA ligase D-like protein (predicted ligase)
MLAYAHEPFDSPRHLFEIKWDGTRCLLFKKGREIRLQNRRLEDITARYPELQALAREIKAKNAVLDGELVVLSEGRPHFGKLQQREHLTDLLKINLLARQLPAAYITFDILCLNDRECLAAPLTARKELLQETITASPYLLESRYILEKGLAFFKETVARGFEGVMAKSLHSPYLLGKRSRYWLKIKPRGTMVCWIIGYTKGRGARKSLFGALALATLEEGRWVYRGRVGSGLTDADLEAIMVQLQAREIERPPLPGGGRIRGMQWMRPELRCEVSFQEEMPSGHLRSPVFTRMVP